MKRTGDNQFVKIAKQANKKTRKEPHRQQESQTPENEIVRNHRQAKQHGWGEKDEE